MEKRKIIIKDTHLNEQGLKSCRYKYEDEAEWSVIIERWKDVPGYEGSYMVSNFGEVRSLDREVDNGKGGTRFLKGKVLSTNLNTSGYATINLSRDGESSTVQVHQLITIVFLGHTPCGHKLVVNHIDGGKVDNRVCNLEIVTNRYNSQISISSQNSVTGVSGVFYDVSGDIYKACIVCFGPQVYLGGHKTNIKMLGELYVVAQKKYESNKQYYKENIHHLENLEKRKYLLGELYIAPKPESSKHKGIYYSESKKRWRVVIPINKKRKQIGTFKTEELALEALLKFKKENGIL